MHVQYLSMHHRVRRLRLFGVPSEAQDWHHGYVQMAKGKGLELSMLGSTPGKGVVDQLFKVEMVSWIGSVMRVRGIEPVLTEEGVASYLQEWEIDLNTAEPGSKEQWMAPGFYEVK